MLPQLGGRTQGLCLHKVCWFPPRGCLATGKYANWITPHLRIGHVALQENAWKLSKDSERLTVNPSHCCGHGGESGSPARLECIPEHWQHHRLWLSRCQGITALVRIQQQRFVQIGWWNDTPRFPSLTFRFQWWSCFIMVHHVSSCFMFLPMTLN